MYTQAQIDLARANGISYENLYNRVYNLGWSVEDAITTPVSKRKDCLWYQYKERCEANGINQFAFYTRVRAGWDMERVCTTPLYTRSGYRPKPGKPMKVSPEALEIAAKNGISKSAVTSRVYTYHWSVERAITEPTHIQFRRKS